MPLLTRRQALAGAAAVAAATAFSAPARAAGKELRMFTWEGYADAEWIKEFDFDRGKLLVG